MTRKKYLRRNTVSYKRLGSNQKSKQVWRRARGRDNKIRESRRGRPGKPQIGERKPRKLRGNVLGKVPVIVKNKEELKKIKPGQLIIIAKLGKKKRKEIIEEIEKLNLAMCQEPPVKDWWHEDAPLQVVLEHTQNSTSDSNHSSKTSGILMFKNKQTKKK